jgi:hypothetical protein
MCEGTKIHSRSGYHNPYEPYKWKSCPYCDIDGCQLVEACESAVVHYFEEMEVEKRNSLMTLITKIDE